ncbi:MAG: hypothetical protein ACLUT1_09480 [Ruminococcus sp.]
MKNLKLGKRVLAAILSAATVVTGISGVANVSTANRVALPVSAESDDTTNLQAVAVFHICRCQHVRRICW